MKNVFYLLLLALFVGSCNNGANVISSNNYIPVKYEKSGRWGYIDYKGNEVLEPEFTKMPTPFYEDYSIVKRKGYYQYLNSNGDLLDYKYIDASIFNEGMACVVKKNGSPMLVDKEFNVVAELNFAKRVGVFIDGLAKFMNGKNKWGFINKKGDIVIRPVYDNVNSFSDGVALVKKGEQKGYINKQGEEIFPFTDRYSVLGDFNEGLAPYSSGNGVGFLDKNGEKAIRAKENREDVGVFNNGKALYKTDGLWGIMDNNGKRLVYPKYSTPLIFTDGVSFYYQDGKVGFVDEEGNKIIRADYFSDIALPFVNGNAIVKEDNYYIVIDKDGEKANNREFYDVDKSLLKNYLSYGMPFNPNSIVESDYFNVNKVISNTFGNIKVNSFGKYNSNITLGEMLKTGIISKDIVPDSPYADRIFMLQRVEGGTMLKTEIVFAEKINKWNSSTNEMDFNPNVKIKSVKITSVLRGKSLGKIGSIYKAFVTKVKNSGYKLLNKRRITESGLYEFSLNNEEKRFVRLTRSGSSIVFDGVFSKKY